MMEISIIIPVYNAEKYLKRCVDSVLASLRNSKAEGEVLLIDNNSTDNSLSLINESKRKFQKVIRILRCNTPGASAVRNFGVKQAHGKYIWFIDADDSISKDAISKLLDQAKAKKADLVMMGAEKVYPDRRKSYLSAIDADDKECKSRFVRYGMGPWQVLIKKKWWKENHFVFREGMIHEDMELMSALILDTDKFASVNEPLYFYYQNPGSVLHKNNFDPHIFDIFPALKSLYQRFVDKDAEKTFHDELEWFFIWNLLIDSARDFAQFPEGKSGFKQSRKMLKEFFPNWRKNRFLNQKGRGIKFKVRLILNYYGVVL